MNDKSQLIHSISEVRSNLNKIMLNVMDHTYTDEQLQFTLLALEQMNISSEYLLNNILKEELNVSSS